MFHVLTGTKIIEPNIRFVSGCVWPKNLDREYLFRDLLAGRASCFAGYKSSQA